MKKWYAVVSPEYDAWDYGSSDYDEAVEMLKKQGYGQIAIIDDDDNFCIGEIDYADLA